MAAGDPRRGLRDDGLRRFLYPYDPPPPPPPPAASFTAPIDDDDDLGLGAMEDLCRMSFTGDDGRIDPDYRGGRRWLLPPAGTTVDGGGCFGRPLLPTFVGKGDQEDPPSYVPPPSSSAFEGHHYGSPTPLSTVRDSKHAAAAAVPTRPLPPPPPPPPPLRPPPPSSSSSRSRCLPQAPTAAAAAAFGRGTSSDVVDPLNQSSISGDNGSLSQLNELQDTFDGLPLLSDEEEANYFRLAQEDLGSLQPDTMSVHQMFAQYSLPRMSGSVGASTADRLESQPVDRFMENSFSSGGNALRFQESSSGAVDRQPAASNRSTTGSRKVLKANRRLGKNKSASSDVPMSSQTSISKYVGDNPSQTKVSEYVIQCLSNFGFCVVDRYMGTKIGTQILDEVRDLELMGLFRDGQLISQTNDTQTIRGDKIVWVERDTKRLQHIPVLIRQLDILMESLNGRIGAYQIKSRSKAMVACYPGHGKGYMRHVDNATQDGRCITCIYYLNKDWNAEKDGGLLRMYPTKVSVSVNIEPNFDRLLLFWSDHRNPHEVQPAFRERHAITVWYFDSIERQRFLQQGMPNQHYSENRMSPISMSCGSRSTGGICDGRSGIL